MRVSFSESTLWGQNSSDLVRGVDSFPLTFYSLTRLSRWAGYLIGMTVFGMLFDIHAQGLADRRSFLDHATYQADHPRISSKLPFKLRQ
jgi:hypothetical protein